MKKELVDYLRTCKEKKISFEQARKELIKKGWLEREVNEVIEFLSLKKENRFALLPPTPMPPMSFKTPRQNLFKRYFSVFGRPSEILEAEKSHVSWGGTFRSLLLAIGIPVMAFTILITMLASNFVSESVKRMLSPLESITISSANGIITGLIAFLMFSALFFLGQFILFRCSKFLKGKGDFKTQTYIISFCAAPIFLLIMFLALITFFLISAMGGMAMVLFMIMGIALAIYAFVLVIKALMSIHGYGSSEAIKSLVAAGVVVGIITYILAMVFGAISFLNR